MANLGTWRSHESCSFTKVYPSLIMAVFTLETSDHQSWKNKKTPEGAYAGCVGLRKNFGYVGWQLSSVCNKCVQERRRCSVKD